MWRWRSSRRKGEEGDDEKEKEEAEKEENVSETEEVPPPLSHYGDKPKRVWLVRSSSSTELR